MMLAIIISNYSSKDLIRGFQRLCFDLVFRHHPPAVKQLRAALKDTEPVTGRLLAPTFSFKKFIQFSKNNRFSVQLLGYVAVRCGLITKPRCRCKHFFEFFCKSLKKPFFSLSGRR